MKGVTNDHFGRADSLGAHLRGGPQHERVPPAKEMLRERMYEAARRFLAKKPVRLTRTSERYPTREGWRDRSRLG
jgi:hypothetical protein